MDLLWPQFLVLLGAIPLLLAAYVWMLRKRRPAFRYSSLTLVRVALPRYGRLRRHLPFAFMLLALSSLIIAAGRPVSRVTIPSGRATIVLAMDVSGSMRQDDIEPSRLLAAQAAALRFVQRRAASTQIGVVAFAAYAELVQPPTADQQALEGAIESLTTARGTAIGSGILEAIDAIAAVDSSVAPALTDASPFPLNLPAPLPEGTYVPHIIVLLTDGVATTGPLPTDAAQQAVDRGVRVYTIGFGTENGSLGFGGGDPFAGSSQQFGGGQGGSGFRRGIDEETLKQVADMTGATYHAASSSDELQDVFAELPTSVITRTEVLEISAGFALAGALLLALALGLALRWNPLP